MVSSIMNEVDDTMKRFFSNI